MLGLADVASARELIATLSVFASALAVALTGDRSVTAAGPTDEDNAPTLAVDERLSLQHGSGCCSVHFRIEIGE
jgi:hypothetical protein